VNHLTVNGPWHLLHSGADMVALVKHVVAAAGVDCPRFPGMVAGEHPAEVPVATKKGADVLLDAMRGAGTEFETSSTHLADDVMYISKAMDNAFISEDTFTLRWFTLMVMYMCDGILEQLSCAAPEPVVTRFMVPFKANMRNQLFGMSATSMSKRGNDPEYVLCTPLEIVATCMIQLRTSYFSLPATR